MGSGSYKSEKIYFLSVFVLVNRKKCIQQKSLGDKQPEGLCFESAELCSLSFGDMRLFSVKPN